MKPLIVTLADDEGKIVQKEARPDSFFKALWKRHGCLIAFLAFLAGAAACWLTGAHP